MIRLVNGWSGGWTPRGELSKHPIKDETSTDMCQEESHRIYWCSRIDGKVSNVRKNCKIKILLNGDENTKPKGKERNGRCPCDQQV